MEPDQMKKEQGLHLSFRREGTGDSIMEDSRRKLVVLLCMHRSGSSLTANLLQKLGMSLGPFDLIGAAPSNPYGHFESVPFHSLNRRIQEWAFGFADDVPGDRDVLRKFVEGQGAWPASRPIPGEWLAEGETAVRTLIESGPVSGFKDPRTVLVWPFWRRVFDAIEDVDVVPVALLRSPHEIAMSLCTRSQGAMPYWNALDVVGVHLARMDAVATEGGNCTRVVRFGTSQFMADSQELAAALGLEWSDEVADRVFDRSCVHHLPAVVPHPAQESFKALSGGDWVDMDATTNAARLAKDARKYEAAMHKQLVDTQAQLGRTLVAMYQNEAKLAEAGGIVQALEARAVGAEAQLADSLKAFDLAKHCLDQTEKNLGRTMESLVSTQERRVSAEHHLAQTQNHVVEIQQAHEQALGRLSAALDRGQALERALIEAQHEKARVEIAVARAQDVLNTTQDALGMTQEAWATDRARLAETQDRIGRIQELTIERDDLYRSALDREHGLWLETMELRKKLERIESHAVLGAALKGRRQIKQIWLKFRHLGPKGVLRTTRIDRPS